MEGNFRETVDELVQLLILDEKAFKIMNSDSLEFLSEL